MKNLLLTFIKNNIKSSKTIRISFSHQNLANGFCMISNKVNDENEKKKKRDTTCSSIAWKYSFESYDFFIAYLNSHSGQHTKEMFAEFILRPYAMAYISLRFVHLSQLEFDCTIVYFMFVCLVGWFCELCLCGRPDLKQCILFQIDNHSLVSLSHLMSFLVPCCLHDSFSICTNQIDLTHSFTTILFSSSVVVLKCDYCSMFAIMLIFMLCLMLTEWQASAFMLLHIPLFAFFTDAITNLRYNSLYDRVSFFHFFFLFIRLLFNSFFCCIIEI